MLICSFLDRCTIHSIDITCIHYMIMADNAKSSLLLLVLTLLQYLYYYYNYSDNSYSMYYLYYCNN